MDGEDYYLSLEKEILAAFEQALEVGRDKLDEVFPGRVDEIIAELMVEAKILVKNIPYIGGDENPFTPNLATAVPVAGFFRVMERHGIEPGKSGPLSIELTKLQYEKVPSEKNLAKIISDRFMADDAVPRWAAKSREHPFPGDFRYLLVWSNGEGGVDFTECAILKYFKAMGLESYVPYLCAQDAVISEICGQGLRRTTTLAEGGNKCDFRYSPGRKTEVKSTVL
jgi:hypothetical protein